MSLHDDLVAAKALIADPEKWGKGSGGNKGPLNPSLCAIGACYVYSDTRGGVISTALEPFLPPGYFDERDDDGLAVARFNDDPATSHPDIMALFDRAIAAASVSS